MVKRKIIIIAVIFVILVLILAARVFINGGEDSWIKDGRGVYIKHGNPSSIPDYAAEQQNLTNCALKLLNDDLALGIRHGSECLGRCGNYAVDLVHVPRSSEDDLPENQCIDFLIGKVSAFIELDANGNIVRIVD